MRVVTFGEHGHPLTEMALEAISGLDHVAHIDAKGPPREPPEADLFLSAAYTRILPPETLAKAGVALNVHPSLLPKYVGSHPVYWAMYEMETVSGVTIHEMTHPVDSGPIVAQQELAISPFDDPQIVYRGLISLARIMLTDTLHALQNGGVESRPQEGERVHRGRPENEAERLSLDWRLPGQELARRSMIFRGWTNFTVGTERIFVDHATVAGETTAWPGTVLRKRLAYWRVATGEGKVLRVWLRDTDSRAAPVRAWEKLQRKVAG